MLSVHARRLAVLLATLTALVLTGCAAVTTTSGPTGVGVQNRVWAFTPAAQLLAPPTTSQSSCSRPGFTASTAGLASGFCVAAEDAGGINISDEALEHIEDRHLPSGANGDDASQFFPDTDVEGLIRDAEGTQPEGQANGRLARVVTSPDAVGYDAATGEYTHTYTVITEANGDLVTAFPGTPRGYYAP